MKNYQLKTGSNNDSFLNLFMANQKRLYNFVLMMMHNYSDADDLMQDTVSLMWEKFDTFKPDTDFAVWGMKIARNLVMNFRRKKQNKQLQLSQEALSQIMTFANEIDNESEDRQRALGKCLQKLPVLDQKLVSLRYEEDNTMRRVAELTGRSRDGIYQTMSRIHRVLQICINRTLSTWGYIIHDK